MTEQRLVVIASPGLSAGFALAGVPVYEAAHGDAAARQIARVVDEVNAGVVMIDEPLYRELPEELRRALQRAGLPVEIPVPGPAWTTESSAHEYIVEILRRAIGYRVKLQ